MGRWIDNLSPGELAELRDAGRIGASRFEGPDDGRFECELGHVHDKAGLPGPTGEGAPCPNDPESPNAYPDE